ncbi:unnamed protein product, partial [marine sediment metagenome]
FIKLVEPRKVDKRSNIVDPAPSLNVGTPNMVEKQVKEIIDKCADGGGLIVGSEIPDDAKLENLKAMIDTCKSYGSYRK